MFIQYIETPGCRGPARALSRACPDKMGKAIFGAGLRRESRAVIAPRNVARPGTVRHFNQYQGGFCAISRRIVPLLRLDDKLRRIYFQTMFYSTSLSFFPSPSHILQSCPSRHFAYLTLIPVSISRIFLRPCNLSPFFFPSY